MRKLIFQMDYFFATRIYEAQYEVIIISGTINIAVIGKELTVR